MLFLISSCEKKAMVGLHYVEKVLSRFGFSDCQPAPMPYDPSVLVDIY
jgi:hypothetical protein